MTVHEWASRVHFGWPIVALFVIKCHEKIIDDVKGGLRKEEKNAYIILWAALKGPYRT